VIHGSVHGGNVLVDENKNAVLFDAKLDILMFGEKQYCQVHPKCWWIPPEQLIVDDIDANDEFALTPATATMPGDIYAVALTIMQLWTLQRPFPHIKHEYSFIIMLRTLATGELARLSLPEEAPAYVLAVLEDCLSGEPSARPTAEEPLGRFEALL